MPYRKCSQNLTHKIQSRNTPDAKAVTIGFIFGGVGGRYSEARRTEARGPKGRGGVGLLGKERRAPSPPARGLGSAVSSPSGVRGEAPAEIDFGAFPSL